LAVREVTAPSLRQRFARWLLSAQAVPSLPAGAVPFKHAARMYAGARVTNTSLGFGSGGSTSADAELSTSLERLRARSRQLVRDSAYAKRARTIVVNNVIGSGVGMQAQVATTRGNLNTTLNSNIEAAFAAWCAADQCHTGGKLHFHDLERMLKGQIFEAGEVLVRKHFRRFGASRVALSLEIIESERLANELVDPTSLLGLQGDLRMGVEVDSFQRPVAYWIRRGHPGDIRSKLNDAERYERVPASDIWHLYVGERWPQTRGVPWMHAVLRKFDDMNEYTASELMAARASAAYFGTIKTAEEPNPLADPGTGTEDAAPVMNIEPLTIQQLEPGDEFDFHAPNRPNAALDPFMRAMLRETAAGCGVSYESLSRDYSQSNYSSSRLALLDDRDLWRTLQQWWIRTFRLPLHQLWLQQAVLGGAVQGLPAAQYAADMQRFEAVKFKPRGWQWVDPTKEVEAYKEGVRAGFISTTDVIAQTGGGMDVEDVVLTRKRELEMFAEAGIELDTTVLAAPEPVAAMPAAPAEVEDDDEADDAGANDRGARRVVSIARNA
jgi:lambda family phage portal protein